MGRQRYSVEIEPAAGAPEPREVALRFGPRGVTAGGDEFGGARRLANNEWIEVQGVRVRVRGADEPDVQGPADTNDWTRPELLISTPGPDGVRRLRLVLRADEGSDLLVGRSGRKNDVVLDDEHVSRRHVRIIVRGGRHVLEDLGSRWGTFVNGARVDGPTPLAHGDEILAGKSVMRFVKFSDGFDPLAEGTGTSRGRSSQGRPQWRPDPETEDAMTFTATTLLNAPVAVDEPPPAPRGQPEGEASISQKLTGWMKKKDR
jgi:pSer/pThr/pTyr-binding forkhead associated (FHA) protein